MNKLLVSGSIDLKKGEYVLKCQTKELYININEFVILYLYNEVLNKIEINLNTGSKLKLYYFNKDKYNDLELVINQNNNSKLDINMSFINNQKNLLTINNNIKGNDNESNINVRNISKKDLSEIIINVNVYKDTINNIALENLKGINNGGFIHIEPNIVASSNEVVANHLTTIGGLAQESLEYLMSKGISEEKAKELLLESFIYSNMDEKIKTGFGGD